MNNEGVPIGDAVIRRRTQLPVALVFVSLLALVLLPLLTQRRIDTLRRDINQIAEPASARLSQIEIELALEAAARRGYLLSGDQDLARRARESRIRRRAAERQLATLAGALSDSAGAAFRDLVAQLDEVDRELDSLITTGVSGSTYAVGLAAREERIDVARVAVHRAARALRDAANERRIAIGRAEATSTAVSVTITLLALLAAALVVYVARGVKKSALRLEESVAAERHSREDAERGRQALEMVTESRARLLRGFTHDVKNPLGAADGHLALLENGVVGPLEERQRQSIARARRAIRQALHLIGQLLDVARAEAGQLEISIAPARMDALLRDVADDFRAMAAAKHITLDMDLADDLPRLLTDATRVDQILGNLVSNAVKYTPPEGRVTVRAAMETDPETSADILCISVADTGPGIARDRQALLFREFTRLDPSAAHGSGIGLAISQRIAQALGGRITVESTLGVGSTFTLRIPVEMDRAAPVAEAPLAQRSARRRPQGA